MHDFTHQMSSQYPHRQRNTGMGWKAKSIRMQQFFALTLGRREWDEIDIDSSV